MWGIVIIVECLSPSPQSSFVIISLSSFASSFEHRSKDEDCSAADDSAVNEPSDGSVVMLDWLIVTDMPALLKSI